MAGRGYAQTVRKVESEQYADYLKDVFTGEYYDNLLPCENGPALTGSSLWKSEKELDPFEQLAMAVISLAVKDYAQALLDIEYAKRRGWRYIGVLDNRKKEIERFFDENELDVILNKIQYEIRQTGIERFERKIRVLW